LAAFRAAAFGTGMAPGPLFDFGLSRCRVFQHSGTGESRIARKRKPAARISTTSRLWYARLGRRPVAWHHDLDKAPIVMLARTPANTP